MKNSSAIQTMKTALTALALVAAVPAMAALPVTAAPSTAPASGDFIGLLTGYAKDIGIAAGLIMALVALFVVVKNVVTAYSEVASGRGTWGTVATQGGAGVLLLVFCVYLLTEASQVI